MSQHIINYKLSAAERQSKIARFTDVADPEDLRAELGAARLLASEALEQGNIALSNLLLTTVAKIAQSQAHVKKMRGDLLERSAIARIVTEVVRILAHAVEDKFDGWEVAMDQAADEVLAVVTTATNESPKLEYTP